MRLAVLPLALALAACQTTQPGVRVQQVRVPAPQPCMAAGEIPAEPARVADDLTGVASQDVLTLAASALELRAWGQEMHTALTACAG